MGNINDNSEVKHGMNTKTIEWISNEVRDVPGYGVGKKGHIFWDMPIDKADSLIKQKLAKEYTPKPTEKKESK